MFADEQVLLDFFFQASHNGEFPVGLKLQCEANSKASRNGKFPVWLKLQYKANSKASHNGKFSVWLISINGCSVRQGQKQTATASFRLGSLASTDAA
ncbi:MAG: hypothetical protein IJW08_02350 [Lentisphaeria bacterium]|nr:hypothetical protein [Lentisphaeria bacterium]